MKNKAVSGIMLTLLLVSMLTLAFNIQPVKADWTWTDTIFIRADGSVEPSDAPILSADNVTYTLTDNIVVIPEDPIPIDYNVFVVQRDNIVINGAGYTLQGWGGWTGIDLNGRKNVTIRNMEIRAFWAGIWLDYSSNNVISGNNITNNHRGICLISSSNNSIVGNRITENSGVGINLDWSNNNSIVGNNITNNGYGIYLLSLENNSIAENSITANNYGIYLDKSSNNFIYHNNFIDNTQQAYIETLGYANVWDNGYPSGGNYWSDYVTVDDYSGVNQDELGSDGIVDTPYIIDENNQDNYPLMSPYEYWSNPILGDINKDMKVDYKDLFQLTAPYGSTQEKPNWNPHADLNNDDTVDCKDLFILGTNYGKEWTYP